MLLFDYVVKEMGFLCEEIEDFVFGFFEKRGVIYMGYGFQCFFLGGEVVRVIVIFFVFVGYFFGFIYDMKMIDKFYVEGVFLRIKFVKRIVQVKLVEYIEKGEIKFFYIYNLNFFVSLLNQRRFRKVFKESDVFVVIYDIFFMDIVLYFDVVLFVNMFFEWFDIVDSYYYCYVVLNELVVRFYGKFNSEVMRFFVKVFGI